MTPRILRQAQQLRASRIALARELIKQRGKVRNIPADLSNAEYLRWRMGCSIAEAEDYLREIKQEAP